MTPSPNFDARLHHLCWRPAGTPSSPRQLARMRHGWAFHHHHRTTNGGIFIIYLPLFVHTIPANTCSQRVTCPGTDPK